MTVVTILDAFKIVYDGDALTLVCRRCGQELHFAQGYHLPAAMAASEEHLLMECGVKGEERLP